MRRMFLTLAAVLAAAAANALAVGDILDVEAEGQGLSFKLEILSALTAGLSGQSFLAKDLTSGLDATIRMARGKTRIAIDDFDLRRHISLVKPDGGKWSVSITELQTADPGVCETCERETPAATSAETGEAVQSEATAIAARLKSTSRAMLASSDSGAFDVASHSPILDVLMVFDAGAVAWLESGSCTDADTVEEFADFSIDKMNMVLEKSQLSDLFSFRCVGVTTCDHTFTTVTAALSAPRDGRDGCEHIPALIKNSIPISQQS